MVDILLTALWIGLSSAALTVILRAAPIINKWALAGKKPWVCDVCMTLWMTGLFTGVLHYQGSKAALAAFAPGYALGKWILLRLSDPMGPPPALPLDDMDSRPTQALIIPPGARRDETPLIASPRDDTNTFYDPEKHGELPKGES